jgi:PAP2 superfamily
MHIVTLIFNPEVLALISVFAAVLWMLVDQEDKTRPLLVFALVINLFFGTALAIVLGSESALLPWKYDLVLLQIDKALGFSAATVASSLNQGVWRIPLELVYRSLLPLMILWYFVQRTTEERGIVLRAYVTVMIIGPLLYAILPACGPIYAFGATWLHPAMVPAHTIRLSGMPNAFPSVHVATAFVFVLLARYPAWRGMASIFLIGTMLATLSTGEHFVVDLIPGMVFGCFAASIGHRRWRPAFVYLGTVCLWSLAIRFGYEILISRPHIVRFLALFSMLLVVQAILDAWNLLRLFPLPVRPLPKVELVKELEG